MSLRIPSFQFSKNVIITPKDYVIILISSMSSGLTSALLIQGFSDFKEFGFFGVAVASLTALTLTFFIVGILLVLTKWIFFHK